jgi:hypothetical protein
LALPTVFRLAQHALDAIATELGVAAASVDQMYQPAL